MIRYRYNAGLVLLLALAAGAIAPLGRASAQTFQEFAVPTANSGPGTIVTALDGNMYFTEFLGNRLGLITTAGAITEFNTLPLNGLGGIAEPDIVVLGSDGNIYFTMAQESRVGRLSTSSPNSPTFFNTPTTASGPGGLTLGPDGNYWFTEIAVNKIGRLTPGGTITEFPIPTANSDPERITLGNDGNLWFTEFEANKIGRITPTGTTITEFSVPTANSQPRAIKGYVDGTIWFTEEAASKIGQISTSGNVLQEIPTPTPNSQPVAIGTGPDGYLWITEFAGNRIGRIVNNTITEFTVPTAGSEPAGFTDGPDGAFWFAEGNGDKIAQFQLVSNGQPLFSSVLPSSRSPQVGNPATAFATIINAGQSQATGCMIAPLGDIGGTFQYQTTNPATNALTGTVNTPVNIAAGAAQTFVIAITPTSPYPPFQVRFGFTCSNANGAPTFFGTNTLQYSASTTPVPDVVALAATPNNDGIMHVLGGSGVIAVATVNVGASGSITAAANTGSATLPLTLSICETNQQTGACLAPPGPSVTTTIAANQTPTFGIFGASSGSIPFVPQTNRIFVQFTDSTGAVRGATSVAVETQ
jgi:virginiamycin B lyase